MSGNHDDELLGYALQLEKERREHDERAARIVASGALAHLASDDGARCASCWHWTWLQGTGEWAVGHCALPPERLPNWIYARSEPGWTHSMEGESCRAYDERD